jgi:nicotinamide-nucleotide amidase
MPAGAKTVPNPVGTAPGFMVEVARDDRPPANLICLPGVPREMKHLMQETVEPYLAERLGPDRLVIKARILRTVGIGESAIDARIPDLMVGLNPTVGLAAHLGQADVRITARAGSEAAADAMIDGVAKQIRQRLGRFVYGEGDEALEDVVIRQLRAAGQKLALFETNTGGEIAQRLSAPDAGGEVVMAAVVWENGESRQPPPWPSEISLPSQDAAALAAKWLLEIATAGQATLAFSLSGTQDPAAGPYGAYRGETFLALASAAGIEHHRIDVGGTGELARRWAGNAALNWLRQWLLDHGE